MKRKLDRWLAALVALCMLLSIAPAALSEEAVCAPETPEIEAVDTVDADDDVEGVPADEADDCAPLAEDLVDETDGVFVLGGEDGVTVVEASPDAGGDAVPAAGTLADGVPITEEYFEDPVLRASLAAYDVDENDFLDEDELGQITVIDFEDNGELTSLSGIKYFTCLREVYCSGCTGLTALDVSGMESLESLLVANGRIGTLDASGCASLQQLFCGGNGMTSLDLFGCNDLRALECSANQLTSLDLSGFDRLEALFCGENQLTAIDLSGCQSLDELEVDRNALTSLDITDCPLLVARYKQNHTLGQDAGVEIVCGYTPITDALFPDPALRGYVGDSIDTDGDGWLSDAEIAAVTVISVGYQGIATLDGIHIFRNLTELSCAHNSLTALDLTGFTALEDLNVAANNLEALDVSPCAQLKNLGCFENALTGLDLSACTQLEQLNCAQNALTSLTLPHSDALLEVRCKDNQLAALDVTGLASLDCLYCENNRLEALTLTGCESLKVLSCYGNAIGALDVSPCPVLARLCQTDPVEEDGHLNYSDDGYALRVDAGVEVITEVGDAIQLISANFPGNAFLALARAYDTNDNGWLAASEIARVTEMELKGLNFSNATGIEHFTALRRLRVEDTALTSLDLRNKPELESVQIVGNEKLTAVDLRGDAALTELTDTGSPMQTTLALSGCAALRRLSCDGLPLTTLDLNDSAGLLELSIGNDVALTTLGVSDMSDLESLWAYGNPSLTEVTISGCPVLTTLDTSRNAMQTSLKVIDCPALQTLHCYETALITLSVEDRGALAHVDIHDTPMKALPFAGCAALQSLDCEYNQLDTLDLTGCTALEELNCQTGTLRRLILPDNPALNFLGCERNALRTLDLTGCPALETLFCDHNGLGWMDLSACGALNRLHCFGNALAEVNIAECPQLVSACDDAEPAVEEGVWYYRSGAAVLGVDARQVIVTDISQAIPTLELTTSLMTSQIFAGDSLQIIIRDQLVDDYKSTVVSKATVSATGLVKGVSPGSARIKVSLPNKVTRTLSLTVVDPTQPKTIEITNAPATMDIRGTLPLEVAMTAAKDGAEPSGRLTWKSSASRVISVSKTGEITAKKVGPATITVTTPNKLSASVTISVVDPYRPTHIDIEPMEKEFLGLKDKVKLTLNMVSEKQPTSAKLTWKSSNAAVASVDKYGQVTGKKVGTAVITVISDNGIRASLPIEVKDIHAPTSVDIARNGVGPIGLKETTELTAVMTAIDEPRATLTWKSSSKKIATVSKTGVVTGQGAGVATITVTTQNKLSATFDIEVVDYYAPTEITLKPLESNTIAVKESVQLTAEMKALREPRSKLTWKSSNSKVVYVDSNGMITGKKAGTATVTVTTANKLSASVTITVA